MLMTQSWEEQQNISQEELREPITEKYPKDISLCKAQDHVLKRGLCFLHEVWWKQGDRKSVFMVKPVKCEFLMRMSPQYLQA